MGYETTLHLFDVKIKEDSLPLVKKALKAKKVQGFPQLVYFLPEAFLSDDGFLRFKSTGLYSSPYCPDEDDETVPALSGKWKRSEEIAEWLKLHSEEGGKLIHHSNEGDGAAWGWEFNGRGKLRELALCLVGKWK